MAWLSKVFRKNGEGASPKPAVQIQSDARGAIFVKQSSLIAAYQSERLEVFDATSSERVQNMSCDRSEFFQITASPDGAYLAAYGDHLSPPGAQYTSDGGEIVLWDIEGGWRRIDLPKPEATVRAAIFLDDGSLAIFGIRHHGLPYINIVNFITRTVEDTIDFPDWVGSPAVSPDRSKIAIVTGPALGERKTILVYNAPFRFRDPVATIPLAADDVTLAFHDNDHLFSMSTLHRPGGKSFEYDHTLASWLVSTGKCVLAKSPNEFLPEWEQFQSLALHPSKPEFVLAGYHVVYKDRGTMNVRMYPRGDLGIVDPATFDIVRSFTAAPNGSVSNLEFTEDGARLLSLVTTRTTPYVAKSPEREQEQKWINVWRWGD